MEIGSKIAQWDTNKDLASNSWLLFFFLSFIYFASHLIKHSLIPNYFQVLETINIFSFSDNCIT